jgi:glycosyltransferase involved in cell wall biosynthesis
MSVVFSILVPTYNQAPYLSGALDSLRAQSFSNWEAVVVNDGSTDDTSAIMEEYARRDSRIRPFHKQNGGVATALNRGLEHACGEWICWLSSDDLFEPDALHVIASSISNNPRYRFFHGDYYHLNETTGIKAIHDTGHPKFVATPVDQVIAFFRFNYVQGISIAVHRSLFREAGLFNPDLRYAQDVDMWLRMSSLSPFYYMDFRTCITRIHGGMGTSHFPEAGPIEVSLACVDFANRNSYEYFFPFLDLEDPDDLRTSIEQTLRVCMQPSSDMYRATGFIPTPMERMAEWLSRNNRTDNVCAVYEWLESWRPAMKQAWVPIEIRQAFNRLFMGQEVLLPYRQRDPLQLMIENCRTLARLGSQDYHGVARYLSQIRGIEVNYV